MTYSNNNRHCISHHTAGSKNLEDYKNTLAEMDTEGLITELKILQRMYFDIYKYNEADSISKLNAIAEKMLSIASFLSTESYSLQWSVDCKIIALIDMGSDIQKYQKSRNDTQGLYDEFIRTSL